MKASQSQVGGTHYKELAIQPLQMMVMMGTNSFLPFGLKYLRAKHNMAEDVAKLRHYLELEAELIGEPKVKRVKLSEDKRKKLRIFLSQFNHIDQDVAFDVFAAWYERRLADALKILDETSILCQNTGHAG